MTVSQKVVLIYVCIVYLILYTIPIDINVTKISMKSYHKTIFERMAHFSRISGDAYGKKFRDHKILSALALICVIYIYINIQLFFASERGLFLYLKTLL